MTLAGQLGGHALPYFSFEIGIDQNRAFGVAEEVDEAGSDDLVARIDRGRCRRV